MASGRGVRKQGKNKKFFHRKTIAAVSLDGNESMCYRYKKDFIKEMVETKENISESADADGSNSSKFLNNVATTMFVEGAGPSR